MWHKSLCLFILFVFSILSGGIDFTLSPATAQTTGLAAGGQAIGQTTLFSQSELQLHGLTRAWYNQVPVGRAANGIAHVLLDRGTLFVVTKQAAVHAYDAETGKHLWHRQLSENKWDTLPPSANSKTFGIVNGSHVSVLDRRNGRLLWQTILPGTAGAGCLMSERFVYVPLIKDRVMCYPQEELVAVNKDLEELKTAYEKIGYQLDTVTGKVIPQGETFAPDEKGEAPYYLKPMTNTPLACASFGNTTLQPILADTGNRNEYIAWVTDKGQLYIGQACYLPGEEGFSLYYRMNVNAQSLFRTMKKNHQVMGNVNNDISFRPTAFQRNPDKLDSKSLILVGTNSGYVIAYEERNAKIAWIYSTGIPVVGRIVVIGSRAYATCEDGNVTCLDISTGTPLWTSPDVTDFVAASPDRLYFKNTMNNLIGIDPVSGAQQRLVNLDRQIQTYFNLNNDRLYLISATGLIQCVHEVSLTQPVEHLIPIERYLEKPKKQESPQSPTPPASKPAPKPIPSISEESEEETETDEFGEAMDDNPFGMETSPPKKIAPTPASPVQAPVTPTPTPNEDFDDDPFAM